MGKIRPLDMKDMAIIVAFPQDAHEKVVLEVGCGDGNLDFYLAEMGYRVWATDVEKYNSWTFSENLSFQESSIFDLSSFPISSAPVVICSQVLEHLEEYQLALSNLLTLTEIRLIITIPYKKSFLSPEHVNFWADTRWEQFEVVHEFIGLCSPHSTSISKIRTKPIDAGSDQYDYLITVDKEK